MSEKHCRCSQIAQLVLPLFSFKFLGVGCDWAHLVRRSLIALLYEPRMINEYGAFGGMRIGRGNRSTLRNLVSVPLCPPQIPHDLTWDRTRAAAVGSRRLTAWAKARPVLVRLLMDRGVTFDLITQWPRVSIWPYIVLVSCQLNCVQYWERVVTCNTGDATPSCMLGDISL
jgi:hypothetical protein